METVTRAPATPLRGDRDATTTARGGGGDGDDGGGGGVGLDPRFSAARRRRELFGPVEGAGADARVGSTGGR